MFLNDQGASLNDQSARTAHKEAHKEAYSEAHKEPHENAPTTSPEHSTSDDLQVRKACAAPPTYAGHTSATDQHRILMLGCGSMGTALLRRWLQQGTHAFKVVTRTHRRDLPAEAEIIESPLQLGSESVDFLIIAVKPQQVASALAPWRDKLKADGTLVSIAAGVSARSLAELSGQARVLRVMPNLPVQVGNGICGVYRTPAVPDDAYRSFMALLQATGEVLELPGEPDLDRLTAVAGSGTGFALEVVANYAESIRRLGFDRSDAERLAVETLLGAAMLARDSNETPEQLRDRVTSAGGTTASGLQALRNATRLDLVFDRTFEAAYRRAVELR